MLKTSVIAYFALRADAWFAFGQALLTVGIIGFLVWLVLESLRMLTKRRAKNRVGI